MSIKPISSSFNFSKLHKGVNHYFEEQLDTLGLGTEVLRQASEEALHRKLIIVKNALDNHESFGKFGIKYSADISVIVSNNKSESLFEVGILPLLLERYQIILERLDEFDKSTLQVDKDINTLIESVKKQLTRVAQQEVNRQLWITIGIMTALLVTISLLIQKLGWDVLEPWTYLFGITLVIGGYVYFAIKQQEFSPVAIYQHALEARKKQLFQTFGVDVE
jgi:hypothetical protein